MDTWSDSPLDSKIHGWRLSPDGASTPLLTIWRHVSAITVMVPSCWLHPRGVLVEQPFHRAPQHEALHALNGVPGAERQIAFLVLLQQHVELKIVGDRLDQSSAQQDVDRFCCHQSTTEDA